MNAQETIAAEVDLIAKLIEGLEDDANKGYAIYRHHNLSPEKAKALNILRNELYDAKQIHTRLLIAVRNAQAAGLTNHWEG